VSFQSPLKCVSVSKNGAQVQRQIVPRLGGRHAEGVLSKLHSGMSLGLENPISWLIAKQWDDLAVPKLVEEGLICIMVLYHYQCHLWLSERTNIVCTEYGL